MWNTAQYKAERVEISMSEVKSFHTLSWANPKQTSSLVDEIRYDQFGTAGDIVVFIRIGTTINEVHGFPCVINYKQ